MKKSVRSPGSATVINAIATGFGAAFGIGLDIKCCANTQNSSITCSNDVGAPTTLMEICAKKTFEKYGICGDITKYFESLHTMGDHCIVQDIDDYISSITGNGLGKA